MSGSGSLTDGSARLAGSLDVRNSREEGAAAAGKPLLLACVVSLAAHALLLANWHVARESRDPEPRLVVRVVAPAAVQAAPAPVEPVPPSRAPAVAAPVPRAPASAVSPTPAARQPARPRVAASVFLPLDALTLPPRARSAPDVGDAGEALRARRHEVAIRVDAGGRVQEAQVTRNEIGPELAQQLEAAVTGVRFVPARLDGDAVGAEFTTRLCFDDAGVLDTSSDGCWRLEGAGSR